MASDFTQLVWKESGVIGFGSKKAADGTSYVIAYYAPGGNNETLGFRDNVNRVTGAGDLDQSQRKYTFYTSGRCQSVGGQSNVF